MTDVLDLASRFFPAAILATRGEELLADARLNVANGASPAHEAIGLVRGGIRLRRYSQPSLRDTLLGGLWIALVCRLMFTLLTLATSEQRCQARTTRPSWEPRNLGSFASQPCRQRLQNEPTRSSCEATQPGLRGLPDLAIADIPPLPGRDR